MANGMTTAGNFHFEWQAVSAVGMIEGKFKQDIFGQSLTEATAQFESFHGGLDPDENGTCLIITCISWMPE
jgi:hypothetical protein